MTSATAGAARPRGAGSNSLDPFFQDRMNNRTTIRTTIYASDLYLLIDREFKLRKSAGCDVCYVQLPYRVDREDEAAANWEIVIPAACPHDCRQLIQDIAAEYGARYDLAEERRG